MKQPRAKIAKYVAEATLKQGVSKKLSRQVAAYLLSEGRAYELNSLLRDIESDWAEAGTVEVIATSAHPLSPKGKADIKQLAKKVYKNAKHIIISEKIDVAVKGGVRLNMADNQLDQTLAAKLLKFKYLTSGKEI